MLTYEDIVSNNLFRELLNFNELHSLGEVHVLFRGSSLPRDGSVIVPSTTFYSHKTLSTQESNTPELPDLVVIVHESYQTIKDMHESARFYLEDGSKMVWLVFPKQRLINTYSSDEHDILTETDTLTGGDLLPGFTLPVADVFRDPLE